MSSVVRIIAPALLIVVAFLSLLGGLVIGGGANAPVLADPGAFVRYGLPMATLLVNLSAAATIGSLVLVCFALTPKSAEFGAAIDVAAGAAAVMTVTSAITGFLTFLSVSGVPLSADPKFGATLGSFVASVSLGQAWLTTTLLAALVTVLCFAVRNHTAIALVAAIAVVSLFPMAEQGHAAGTASHAQAVTALAFHVIFVAIWLGGLLTVILLRRKIGPRRIEQVVRRYSALALVCFIVVAASGYASAALRIGTIDQIATPYGILVLIKAGALVVIGVFGYLHRRYLIGKLSDGSRAAFWWMVTAELAVMGLASGVAAALARTATPVPQTLGSAPTPAAILTGEPLPPPATPLSYLTGVNVDLTWMLACAFGIAAYLAGMVRLRRQGRPWPIHRAVLWIVGLLLLFYATNGGLNVYEKYLFGAHMVALVVVAVVVPLLIVPAAPVTLLLAAVAGRTDGSRGAREWARLVVDSRVARMVTNPIVAAVLFAAALWFFSFTPALSWSVTDVAGHEWMFVLLLVIGYLFVLSFIGLDPVHYRLPHAYRLAMLGGAVVLVAAFGVRMLAGSDLFLADWYGAMGRTWGPAPLTDQQIGGGIAWGIAAAALIALAAVVVVDSRRRGIRNS